MSIISSNDEDRQIPNVVTLSTIVKAQSTLWRERDDRIAFLEKELVETRLQLASAKTLEDQLFLKLHKMGLALAKATKISTSEQREEPREVGTDDDVRRFSVQSQPYLVRTISPEPPAVSYHEGSTVRATENSTEPREVSSDEGYTLRLPLENFRVPLGKPIISHGLKPNLSYSRRKRDTVPDSSWHHLNPGSCASGLDLLNGLMPSVASTMNLSSFQSSSSISRNTVQGLSSSSLKKRKSGDLAASHSRMNISAGSNQRNEGWAEGIPNI